MTFEEYQSLNDEAKMIARFRSLDNVARASKFAFASEHDAPAPAKTDVFHGVVTSTDPAAPEKITISVEEYMITQSAGKTVRRVSKRRQTLRSLQARRSMAALLASFLQSPTCATCCNTKKPPNHCP